MFYTSYLIVLILVTNVYSMSNEICRGPNEEWLPCGPGCVRTCDNYYETMECDKPCVKGCFCKPGYVRNSKFRCVLPEHCYEIEEPPLMECNGLNEVYNPCGTGCPLTCENYRNPPTCIRKCIPGCFCEPGYVRDVDGVCVHPKECMIPGVRHPPLPNCKNANETYLRCGSMCPETCNTLGMRRKCSKRCVPGCFCKKGYVRDSKNNCILKAECPPRVKTGRELFECDKPFEEYLTCGMGCQYTCKNYNTTFECDYNCVEGCFCKTGFIRDDEGYCILPEDCPRDRHGKCRYLEMNPTKKRPCSGTCENPDSCKPAPPGSCICIEGTVRDEFGQCVYPEFCPLACYGLNEVFDCGSPCDLECAHLGEPCPIHTYDCVPQCYCKPGYARDHRYRCVPIKRCPRQTSIMEVFLMNSLR